MSLLQELINEGYSHNRANVDDLALFVNNNPEMHQMAMGIVKKCGEKYVASCWKRFGDKAAKAYAKHMHKDVSLWNRIFSVPDRKKAMKELFTQAKNEYKEKMASDKEAVEQEELASARDYDRRKMMGIGAEEHYDSEFDHAGSDVELDKDHSYDESKEKKRREPNIDPKMASAFITGKYKKNAVEQEEEYDYDSEFEHSEMGINLDDDDVIGSDVELDKDHSYDESKEKKRREPNIDPKMASAFIAGKYRN